jgi:hypothetical protein
LLRLVAVCPDDLEGEVLAADASPRLAGCLPAASSVVPCRGKKGKANKCPSDRVRLGDSLVQQQCLLILGLGSVVIGACPGDISQVLDAVGLADHVADLPIQRSLLCRKLH